MDKSENNLVAWIAERFGRPGDVDLPIGIGDDMAMVRAASGEILIAADMLMDGVHFDSTIHEPERIGRKALAANLSDCAGMAVRPRYALVSMALPNAWSMEQAQRLFLGMEKLAKQFDVRIIGGDTNSWDRPLVIDVTVVAEPWPGIGPVTRRGMKLHDLVVVTGTLGGSRGGHHLDFEPRVREAKWLAKNLGSGLHAMMDLSDGLSTDAARMGVASTLGIELEEQALLEVATDEAKEAAHGNRDATLQAVLNDGEDFELLFTVNPESWTDLRNPPQKMKREIAGHLTALHRTIGKVVEKKGLWLRKSDESICAIEPGGWQHFK